MLDRLKTYWFLGSTAAIAILLFMYQRKGQQLAEVVHKLRMRAINEKLKEAKERMRNDKLNYATHRRRYDELKSRLLPIIDSSGPMPGVRKEDGEGN